MNVQVQFIGGGNYNSTDVVSTNSSDIVVGPVVVTDFSGDVVSTNGKVLSTVFFINVTASPQAVNVTVGGDNLNRLFEIVDTSGTFIGTGDYSGQSGTFTLGDDSGVNGNRTIGGTIVLDSLLVPSGVTLNVNVTDLDASTPGNQGYLPAVILVDGPVQINGTIDIAGQVGQSTTTDAGGDGGDGGPGGGGGAGGGSQDNNAASDGGDGFTGGGAGGCEEDQANCGEGTGGDGTGSIGTTGFGGSGNGGDGGVAINGNVTAGGGGKEISTQALEEEEVLDSSSDPVEVAVRQQLMELQEMEVREEEKEMLTLKRMLEEPALVLQELPLMLLQVMLMETISWCH